MCFKTCFPDNLPLCILILLQTSSTLSMFYHEPSCVVFEPDEKLNTSNFGFSMGYLEEKHELVVGSPHADQVGRVYRCHIDSKLSKRACENIIIDAKTIAPDYDHKNVYQSFCLGATIAVTSKYFVTCAPLWTQSGIKHYSPDTNKTQEFSGSYGKCFIYSQRKAHQFNGIVEQMKNTDGNNFYGAMYGGVGWSLLADEKNELLLLAKPFSVGDIQYVNSTDLERDKQRGSASLYFSKQKPYFKAYFEPITNIGYALAAGKFFADLDNTLYAFSMKSNKKDIWGVKFLYQDKKDNNVMKLDKWYITSQATGDMFGAAMSSADINADGLTDLLVGAPAHSQAGRCETGALYIYLGGKSQENFKKRYKIVSDKPQSRFGSAIVTTNLDGDSLPEIVVSAPYEDSRMGAVYIISGNELNHVLTEQKDAENDTDGIILFKLEKFKRVQRIQNKESKSFGFSLQVVRDIDGNGCDELALGSPRSASVTILRCVPTVTATISVKRPTEVVKITDSNFTVEVCVTVSYQAKPENISTKLQVVSEVRGKGAKLLTNEKFDVDLLVSLKNSSHCKNLTVKLREGEKGTYILKAKLGYQNEALLNSSEFDPTWVRLSEQSHLEETMSVKRTCEDNDCDPKLSMEILWDGSKDAKEFQVDKKMDKNVTLVIKNDGANAYDACVKVKITSAKGRMNCVSLGRKGEYQCHLPKPIAKHGIHNLNFFVSIEEAKNFDNMVHIEAKLFNDCQLDNSSSKAIDVKYNFSMRNVLILEESHNLTVTNTQIQNLTNPILTDKHEYQIINKGGLMWENVNAVLNVRKKAYYEKIFVLIKEVQKGCDQKNDTRDDAYMTFVCSGIKISDNPILIYVITVIPNDRIKDNLVNGGLKIESNIEMRMESSNNSIELSKKSQTTTIKYIQETSIANNKNAINIIVVSVASLILLIVALILYKVGFFQRKEKKRLDTFKASIRIKNPSEHEKPPTSLGAAEFKTGKDDSIEDFEDEGIEDCAFGSVPASTTDDVTLVVKNKNKSNDTSLASSVVTNKR